MYEDLSIFIEDNETRSLVESLEKKVKVQNLSETQNFGKRIVERYKRDKIKIDSILDKSISLKYKTGRSKLSNASKNIQVNIDPAEKSDQDSLSITSDGSMITLSDGMGSYKYSGIFADFVTHSLPLFKDIILDAYSSGISNNEKKIVVKNILKI